MLEMIISLAVLVALILIVAAVIQENKKGGGIMSVIKMIYLLTMVAFLIMFVAFGISTFYGAPEDPKTEDYPVRVMKIAPPDQGSADYVQWQAEQEMISEQQQKINEENQKLWEAHNESMKDYRRNVFLIAYPFGMLFVVLGLTLKPRLEIITPALLLGGMGTVIYALSQGDLSNQLRFIGVTVGLLVLIYAGYKTLIERKPVSKAN